MADGCSGLYFTAQDRGDMAAIVRVRTRDQKFARLHFSAYNWMFSSSLSLSVFPSLSFSLSLSLSLSNHVESPTAYPVAFNAECAELAA